MFALNHGEWKLHYSFNWYVSNFDAKFTVGTYSDGNLLVVYEKRGQVFPTAPFKDYLNNKYVLTEVLPTHKGSKNHNWYI